MLTHHIVTTFEHIPAYHKSTLTPSRRGAHHRTGRQPRSGDRLKPTCWTIDSSIAIRLMSNIAVKPP